MPLPGPALATSEVAVGKRIHLPGCSLGRLRPAERVVRGEHELRLTRTVLGPGTASALKKPYLWGVLIG